MWPFWYRVCGWSGVYLRLSFERVVVEVTYDIKESDV